MNLLGRIINKLTGNGLAPVTSRVVHNGRSSAGVWIDSNTALRNSVVWGCVQYLTKAVGQLPWHVYLSDDDGDASVQKRHQVDWLISQRPAYEEYGSFAWRSTMLGRALLQGNAYAEIERDGAGRPVAMWPLETARVKAKRDEDGRYVYEVWNHAGVVVLPAMDVFHLRGFGDGPVGLDVIQYAANSIGWAQATELFGATYFKNGMNPTTLVTTKDGLSPDGLAALRKNLDQVYGGAGGSRTAVLDAGMEVVKLTQTPDESQFIETRQHQVEEICRWFGCPPHKVMHLLRATFSNIEHQSIEVVVDSVAPWAIAFEQEANYKLFGSNRSGFYTKMSLQALMRGDNESRIKFYKGLSELGVPLNRILALEDMNGIGPDGEVSFVSNNVQTIKNAIAAKPDTAGKKPPAAAPADDDPPAVPAGKRNGAGNGKAAH